jgi:hypothetical protein
MLILHQRDAERPRQGSNRRTGFSFGRTIAPAVLLHGLRNRDVLSGAHDAFGSRLVNG